MLALILFLIVIAGVVVMFGAGLRATTRYPHPLDPERNAPRYVLTAMAAFVVAVVALVTLIGVGVAHILN